MQLGSAARVFVLLAAMTACGNESPSSPTGGGGSGGAGGSSSGGSSSGGSSTGGSAAGGSSTGGGGTGGGGPSDAGDRTLAVLHACQDRGGGFNGPYCTLLNVGPICTAINVEYTAARNDACIDAAIAAFGCEATLSCMSRDVYLQGPTEHPACGAKAKNYQDNCGFRPQPAPGCVAYCDKVAACESNARAPGCAYNCNLTVGGIGMGRPAACGQGYDDLYACYANLDCPTIHGIIFEQKLPLACDEVNRRAFEACQ